MIPKEMIEAGARALCRLEGFDPDGPASHFDDGRELLWEGWKIEADAVLTAALPAQWMEMDSALEKDGTEALLYVPGVGAVRGVWLADTFVGEVGRWYACKRICKPTHWQDLLPPPAMKEHKSDCAVNNGPALPVGECDCGAERKEGEA